MNNKIQNWSYDKPTEEGIYLACYGDIETEDAIRFVRTYACPSSGTLMTTDGLRVSDYNPSFKWARLLVGSKAK